MGLLPCPLACQIEEENDSDHDKSQPNNFRSESSSSSNYFLSSQPSLPSVPSLTPPPSQQAEQPSSTTYHHCAATLKGHSSYVFSLSLSGKYLYSGSSNSEIRVWSRDPSAQDSLGDCNVVAEGNSSVKCIVISGDKLFSAHQDHKIRVWRINSETPNAKYKCVATLPTVNDRCMKLFLPRNYLEVRRHKKCTWVHHVDAVSALALSKDGSFLYSASWDRTFKVWRTSDFTCLESIWKAHDDAINAIASSSDGCVYTGSADRKIKVWKKINDDKKHSLISTLEEHKSAVNALALSADGSVLYSGACDRSIIVWEKDGGDGQMVVAGALRGHSKAILCLAVVSDLVFSGSADKTIRVWRRGVGKSYACLAVLEGHNKPVKCLTAASVDNSGGGENSYIVYSGSLDGDIKVWRIWVPLM